MNELIIDNFAGGGGASTGIEMATGRSVDIAINHDPDASQISGCASSYARKYALNGLFCFEKPNSKKVQI